MAGRAQSAFSCPSQSLNSCFSARRKVRVHDPARIPPASGLCLRTLRWRRCVSRPTSRHAEKLANQGPRCSFGGTRHETKRKVCEKALQEPVGLLARILPGLSSVVVSAAAAATILLAPASADVISDNLADVELSEETSFQSPVTEAWAIIRETYVDPTFNNTNWDDLLGQAISHSSASADEREVYESIQAMVGQLGDPFTRFVPPKEYGEFTISNEGGLEGVGLRLTPDPATGHMLVVSPLEGGPAFRAGISEGDELLSVDGVKVTGLPLDETVQKLRGRSGTTVELEYLPAHARANVMGQRPQIVRLSREFINISPVFATMLPHTTAEGKRVGYIQLSTFSQNATEDMARAFEKLEGERVDAYILDLRNNLGGLVHAGLDIAEMLLPPDATHPVVLVNTTDRIGNVQPLEVTEDHTLTRDPVVVLVNAGTASASEILAGALQDNQRAVLVGERTYGKGRIQSVFELSDGSALFVTIAKYLSPNHHAIDLVGLTPDVMCKPEPISASEVGQAQSSNSWTIPIEDDSCVQLAERQLDHWNL